MRLYRVTWVDDDWATLDSDEIFHPLHVAVDRQGQGRFDNPHLYAALYAATTPQAAIGETFGNFSRWADEELRRTKEGRVRCLVGLDIDDDTRLLDLDDPAVLVELGLRPSDIVRRNRDHTQEVANSLWRQTAGTGTRGLVWRSYWRPEWSVVVLWSENLDLPRFPDVAPATIEPLHMDLSAVQVAADVLPRELGW